MDKPTFTVKISFSDAAKGGDEPPRRELQDAAELDGGESLTFGVADWVWDVQCDQRTLRLVLDRPQRADPARLH